MSSKTFTGLGFAGWVLASVGGGAAWAQVAPWEPSLVVVGERLDVRRVRAATTVSDRLEVLTTDSCTASVTGLSLRFSERCEFLSGVYTATLRTSHDGKTVRAAFPFSLQAQRGGHTLLVETPEVLD